MMSLVFRVRTDRVSPVRKGRSTIGNIADCTQLPFCNGPIGISPGSFTSIPPNLSGRHRRAKIA